MTSTKRNHVNAATEHVGTPLQRQPRPVPRAEEKARRRAEQAVAAAAAMADHDERERSKRANMERLKAQRLAAKPSNDR